MFPRAFSAPSIPGEAHTSGERTSLVSNCFEPFLLLHKNLTMRSSGHGPKLYPGYVFAASPMAVGESTSAGILVGYLGYFPLSIWSNFGLLSASLGYLPLQHVWKVCLILALNQDQYFNGEKWYKTVNRGFPPTKLITLLQPSFPFPTHPRSPFLLTHLLSLNLLFPFPLLPADSFPFQVGPSPTVTLLSLSHRHLTSGTSVPRQRRKKTPNILNWSECALAASPPSLDRLGRGGGNLIKRLCYAFSLTYIYTYIYFLFFFLQR